MSTTSQSEFEKLLSTSGEEKWKKSVEYRRANKDWLSLSADIAMKVMDEMDKQNIKGNQLAKRMNVSSQQVSKILKGRENLKLETIAKLNEALGVKLFHVLEDDELIVKKDLKSLMETLTKEMVKYHITKKIQEVSQQPKKVEIQNPSKFEKYFSSKPEYVIVSGNSSKKHENAYAMAS